MLEEEVSCLRDILSNLVLEESAILSRDLKKIEAILKERKLLHKQLRSLRKNRIEKDVSPALLSSEDICYHQQIEALNEKIASQKKLNLNLKRRGPLPLHIPLAKKETKKRKKPLLLEDDPNE